jgi:hypothetical protein
MAAICKVLQAELVLKQRETVLMSHDLIPEESMDLVWAEKIR